MANKKHLRILKRGVDAWNAWRVEHPEARPDFSDANLSYAEFIGAHLIDADLSLADLRGTNLSEANLRSAHLGGTNLRDANLTHANLIFADLARANLRDANLTHANLYGATIGWTALGDRDLRVIEGLKTIIHAGPSPLSVNTIYLSEGDIPETFMRGTGAPDTFITYIRSLVSKPIQYYTCFISYSSKDQAFAERLYADLQSQNVRCWYAPEDLKIGEKFRVRIDESIRLYDKLLLVLSEHSVRSLWVEKEVETAFEKEHRQNTLVLFPVKLDNTVMETDQAWAADIRRMRHIGDFTRWKEHDEYQKGLSRLLRDLKQDAVIDTSGK